MSKEDGYTNQTYNITDWSSLSKWIKEKWDAGYYITNVCYNGQKWVVVMSKNSKFTSQGYLWANDYSEMNAKIKSKVWDNGRNVQLINYGGGEYFVVYCKYKDNNGRGQSYIENPNDVKNYSKRHKKFLNKFGGFLNFCYICTQKGAT